MNRPVSLFVQQKSAQTMDNGWRRAIVASCTMGWRRRQAAGGVLPMIVVASAAHASRVERKRERLCGKISVYTKLVIEMMRTVLKEKRTRVKGSGQCVKSRELHGKHPASSVRGM